MVDQNVIPVFSDIDENLSEAMKSFDCGYQAFKSRLGGEDGADPYYYLGYQYARCEVDFVYSEDHDIFCKLPSRKEKEEKRLSDSDVGHLAALTNQDLSKYITSIKYRLNHVYFDYEYARRGMDIRIDHRIDELNESTPFSMIKVYDWKIMKELEIEFMLQLRKRF